MFIQELDAKYCTEVLKTGCRVEELNQVACEGMLLLSILKEKVNPLSDTGELDVLIEKANDSFASVLHWCINFNYLQEKEEVV